MAKKYRITDENGEQYEVEEVEEVKGADEDPIPEADIPAEADALSPEEIAALKKLAAAADQLIALIGTQDACKDEGEEEIEEETIEEDGEDIGEDETEEQLVDTDEKVAGRDSKKSFGAIEKKTAKVDDEIIDDVSDAWAKRFGGAK